MGWIPLVVLIVVVILAAVFMPARATFVLELKEGRVVSSRGRVPPRLEREFRQALGHVSQGRVRAYRESGGYRLDCSGDIDSGTEQRLKNILGLYQS